jgi:hypothetical protein
MCVPRTFTRRIALLVILTICTGYCAARDVPIAFVDVTIVPMNQEH